MKTNTLHKVPEKKPEPLALLKELLPQDLDPVSPESDEMQEDDIISEDKAADEEEASPPFEPIEEIRSTGNSNDSHLSGISGLTSHDSETSFSPSHKNDSTPQMHNIDVANHDSQLSKVSSGSRLSIAFFDDHDHANKKLVGENEVSSGNSRKIAKVVSQSNKLDNSELSEQNISNNTADGKTHGTHTQNHFNNFEDGHSQSCSQIMTDVVFNCDKKTSDSSPEQTLKENIFNNDLSNDVESHIYDENKSETDECFSENKKMDRIPDTDVEVKYIKEDSCSGSFSNAFDHFDIKANETFMGVNNKCSRIDEITSTNVNINLTNHVFEKTEDVTAESLPEKDCTDFEKEVNENVCFDKDVDAVEGHVNDIRGSTVNSFKNKDYRHPKLSVTSECSHEETINDKNSSEFETEDFSASNTDNSEENLDQNKFGKNDVNEICDVDSASVSVNTLADDKLERSINKVETGKESHKDHLKKDGEKDRIKHTDKAIREKDRSKHEKSLKSSSRERSRHDKNDRDVHKARSRHDKDPKDSKRSRHDDKKSSDISKDRSKREESVKERIKHDDKNEKDHTKHEKNKVREHEKSEKDGNKEKTRRDSGKDKSDKSSRSGKDKLKHSDDKREKHKSKGDDKFKDKSKTNATHGKNPEGEIKDKSKDDLKKDKDRSKYTKSKSDFENQTYEDKNSKVLSEEKTEKEKSNIHEHKEKIKDKSKVEGIENSDKRLKDKQKIDKNEDRGDRIKHDKNKESNSRKHDRKKSESDSIKSAKNSDTKGKDPRKKEKSVADDHHIHRDKHSEDRRSADRDSNGTSFDKSRTNGNDSQSSQKREKRNHNGDGKSDGGNGDSSGSNTKSTDCNDDASSDTLSPTACISSPPSSLPFKKRPLPQNAGSEDEIDDFSCSGSSGKLVLKIRKPKIAANIYEVKKIMHLRKSFSNLENRQRRRANIFRNKIKRAKIHRNPKISENKSQHSPCKDLLVTGELDGASVYISPSPIDNSDEELHYFPSETSTIDPNYLAYLKNYENSTGRNVMCVSDCSDDETYSIDHHVLHFKRKILQKAINQFITETFGVNSDLRAVVRPDIAESEILSKMKNDEVSETENSKNSNNFNTSHSSNASPELDISQVRPRRTVRSVKTASVSSTNTSNIPRITNEDQSKIYASLTGKKLPKGYVLELVPVEDMKGGTIVTENKLKERKGVSRNSQKENKSCVQQSEAYLSPNYQADSSYEGPEHIKVCSGPQVQSDTENIERDLGKEYNCENESHDNESSDFNKSNYIMIDSEDDDAGNSYKSADNNNVDKSSSDDEKVGLSTDLILSGLRDLLMESGMQQRVPLEEIRAVPDVPAQRTPNRHKLGRSRRPGLSRPAPGKGLTLDTGNSRMGTPDFVMPLSPESDVSASSGEQAKKQLENKGLLYLNILSYFNILTSYKLLFYSTRKFQFVPIR